MKKLLFIICSTLLIVSAFSISPTKKASAESVPVLQCVDTLKAYTEVFCKETQWIYPNENNSSTNIDLWIDSSSNLSGDYMIYLQRAVGNDWVNVAHTGAPRQDQKYVNFYKEYDGHSLYSYTPYRFLLRNDKSAAIYYNLTAR